jgi:3-mercaptopyruvate sulfurtransferase SseA
MGYKNVSSLKGGLGAWKTAKKRLDQNVKTYSERVEY